MDHAVMGRIAYGRWHPLRPAFASLSGAPPLEGEEKGRRAGGARMGAGALAIQSRSVQATLLLRYG